MQTRGVSRLDFERLGPEIKSKIAELLAEVKTDLKRYGFSLTFLEIDGRWKNLTAARFLALPENHYARLVMGSKWVTSTKRRDLVVKISELYELASQTTSEYTGLDEWLS